LPIIFAFLDDLLLSIAPIERRSKLRERMPGVGQPAGNTCVSNALAIESEISTPPTGT